MAITVLFLSTSQQVGSTYGGFNDNAQTDITIGLCEIFPGSIKQMLAEFKEHVNKAVALKDSLKSYPISESFSGVSGIEGMSLEDLEIAEQEIAAQIAALQLNVSGVNEQLATNSQIWNEINNELNAAATALLPIGGYMSYLDSNCLEIKDQQFFQELQSNLNQSGVISESLNASLNGIIRYLTSINSPGIPFYTGVTSDVYGQMELGEGALLQPFPSVVTFQPPTSNISSSLISSYEGLNTEMISFKEAASAGFAQLQDQLQLINQTRDKQLEELEQARLKELAELKKEEELVLKKKQEQEAEDKAKAEEAAKKEEDAKKDKDTKKDEQPTPEVLKPETDEDLPTSLDTPKEEVPLEKPATETITPETPTKPEVSVPETPKAEVTTPELPSATEAPSEPQQDKGGN